MQTLRSFFLVLLLNMLTACSPSIEPVERAQQALAAVPDSKDATSAVALLRRQLSRSATNLRVSEGDGGVLYVRVVEGFQHATIAVRAPDGRLVRHCVSNSRDALQLLGEHAP